MPRLRRNESKRDFRAELPAPSQAIHVRGEYWLLRGLFATGKWRRFVLEPPDGEFERMYYDQMSSELGAFYGFLGTELCSAEIAGKERSKHFLMKRYRDLRARPLPAFENGECLRRELGLSVIETDLLLFGVLAKGDRGFQEGLGAFGVLSSAERVFETIAICLDLTAQAVAVAFDRGGILARLGLVRIDYEGGGLGELDDWINVLPGFSRWLAEPALDAAKLLSAYVKAPTQAPRALADFAHIAAAAAVLKPLIEGALRARAQGVNVLLHGATGTGKTALAQALAKDLGVRLLEVSVADNDGDALRRQGRVQALRLVGRLGAIGPGALVLFDEVEDYFFGRQGLDASGEAFAAIAPAKGYTADLMETSPVPTFWITNTIRGIDVAFLRRFDFVLEVPPPPPPVRARIAAEYLAPLGIDDEALRARIAAHDDLAPGLIAKAARAAELAQCSEHVARAAIFEATLDGHLAALGLPQLAAPSRPRIPYATQYLNIPIDPERLIAGLRAAPQGRLLFHGASGSGKSALARHLAEALGLAFLAYRASDLLGPYVGQSEQAIGAMFRRARDQRALLVLDECDSFLGARAHARQHWEVTLVNEVLTQMEDYPGLFIATTNARDSLDTAALRRFDLKLEFRALAPEKAFALFAAVLAQEGCALSRFEHREWRERLALLSSLTPGDFRAALRGLSIRGARPFPGVLYAALKEECDLKEPQRKLAQFGFVPPARCPPDAESQPTPRRRVGRKLQCREGTPE
jgi:SpoVK/Ycf46/Vps4 family AAA+-type ATPase